MDMFENLKRIQEKLKESKEVLDRITVEGQSGAGLVKVKMNGDLKVLSLSISPNIVDKAEVKILEDLVMAAINDAQEKARGAAQEGLIGQMDIGDIKDILNGGN